MRISETAFAARSPQIVSVFTGIDRLVVSVSLSLEPEMNGQGLVYQSKPLESNARISR